MDKKLIQLIEAYKTIRDMGHKYEIQWLGRFFELIAYKEKYGNTDVSSHSLGKYKTLGGWVRWQRKQYALKVIDPAREELLKMVGFNFWIIPEWDAMFNKLVQFKEEFGHTRITATYKDQKLCAWLKHQRMLCWTGKQEGKKYRRLEEIGVIMQNIMGQIWDKNFEQLVNFKKQHGHLYICRYYTNNEQLINFMRALRRSKNKLSKEKIKKLESIGFIWDPGRELVVMLIRERGLCIWMENYEKLKEYKKENGNCRVSRNNKKYHKLSNWVRNQRRNNILSNERHKLLAEIGFFD